MQEYIDALAQERGSHSNAAHAIGIENIKKDGKGGDCAPAEDREEGSPQAETEVKPEVESEEKLKSCHNVGQSLISPMECASAHSVDTNSTIVETLKCNRSPHNLPQPLQNTPDINSEQEEQDINHSQPSMKKMHPYEVVHRLEPNPEPEQTHTPEVESEVKIETNGEFETEPRAETDEAKGKEKEKEKEKTQGKEKNSNESSIETEESEGQCLSHRNLSLI